MTGTREISASERTLELPSILEGNATTWDAAIKRRDLLALGFQYDNLVIEEAAQIMEVETFIPMVLQAVDAATGKSRLKRVVLIGDHHQLPPVVKNLAFQKYSRLDQSLFARFVRLGAPLVQLDRQGRARAAMAMGVLDRRMSCRKKDSTAAPPTATAPLDRRHGRHTCMRVGRSDEHGAPTGIQKGR